MNIILMGPQGSGKSTQAQLLAKELKLTLLSTGDACRKISQENTPLGKRVEKIMNSGALVDDKTILEIVEEFLQRPDYQKGVVFEGFPRNLFQAENLKVKIDQVFYLTLSRKESLRRLTARRICKKCGANFNLATQSPKKEGKCDLCEGELFQRIDDKEEAVLKRLKLFDEQTKPLLDFYKKQGVLQEVDGEGQIPVILKDILERLS